MVTLQDVARRAGVSISAVSRVLRDDPAARVTPATDARIRLAAAELGYSPNFAGRALKLARTNAIALVVPDLTNAIFTELTAGLEDGARAIDYVVLLGRAEGLGPAGGQLAELVAGSRVDGVVVQVRNTAEADAVVTAVGGRLPVVLINSDVSVAASSISLQDRRGSKAAVDALIALGHRRIGMLGGAPHDFTADQRELGYRDAMDGLDEPERPQLVQRTGYQPEDGRDALRCLMALPEADRPTALYVANVNAAFGALKEARALGIRVPDDLSMIAMHDAWTAEHTWPPLSTVKMPLYEMGRRAVELLRETMESREVKHDRIEDPAPKVLLRESTARPRASR